MKNKNTKMISALLAGVLFLSPAAVFASEYEGNEADWYNKCSSRQESKEDLKACQGFQTYQENKLNSIQNKIEDLEKNLQGKQSETENLETKLQEQKKLLEELTKQLEAQRVAAATMDVYLNQSQKVIEDKQSEMEDLSKKISEWVGQGLDVEGSFFSKTEKSSGVSLAEKMEEKSGNRTNALSEVNRILELQQEEEDLNQSMSVLDSLRQQQQNEIDLMEKESTAIEKLTKDYEQSIQEYQNQIAELEAQKRQQKTDLDAVKQYAIDADLSAEYVNGIPSSDKLINPVVNGKFSAGTWHYPGGGLHLGLDLTAPVGTDLKAPANGLIIYASHDQPAAGGFLGNWSGFPMGSGNYIEMLCKIKDTVYAISFSHLSQDFHVEAGDVVKQGQVIAQTGNSGNSSGPHTHIEIYNLGKITMKQAVDQFEKDFDVTFGTNWGYANKACDGGNSAPCRERPESLISLED